VDVLKEHFSTFGDFPSVELEDLEPQDCNNGSEMQNTSASLGMLIRVWGRNDDGDVVYWMRKEERMKREKQFGDGFWVVGQV
ncbi:hypothetical protein HAX54_032114, partial [Datura stramonium]|nr:hypothetical protein [Datura stramonium]